MKIAIVGSRNFLDFDFLKEKIDPFLNDIDLIVSGGAKGADSLAEKYAKVNNLTLEIFKPDWKKYGRTAGPIRNKSIIESADIVFAFWDGKSKGTKNSIDISKKLRKKIYVFKI